MKKIEFVKPVYSLNEIPKEELPTVVLCGRSNVGKSSFINCLFKPLKVAKTSSTPGKTRSINYYLVENKFYLVDLPGFGYAKVSIKERDYWQRLLERYFEVNKNIVLAFHIIDSRHEPTKLDIGLNNFLTAKEITYNVILNKSDKLKQSELAKARKKIREYFPELLMGDNLFLFSSVNGTGKKEIIRLLNSLLL
ncbi:MAG: YihA family ribosome biogenesis GTP-binding protein [Ignavibacteriales bacterium]|nr:YihA family ribosome biogenesis GTP-binding protein [Ignavibacteriales bacterium]